jgi:hypothetical protein
VTDIFIEASILTQPSTYLNTGHWTKIMEHLIGLVCSVAIRLPAKTNIHGLQIAGLMQDNELNVSAIYQVDL